MPSIEMLMTPLRSLRMPPSAPSVMGTLRLTVSWSMPTKLKDSPDAAHDRNDMKKAAVASASTTLDARPKPRTSCTAASATSSTPSSQPKRSAGSANDPVSDTLNVASPARRVKMSIVTAASTR